MLFKAAKLGEASGALVVGAAALATALTFGLVWLLVPRGNYFYSLFFERSWIQYVTTFCFWVTMAVLAVKHLAFLHERRAYEAARRTVAAPEFGSTLIWSDADMVRHKFADERHRAFHSSITFSRILNALDRLRKTQSTRAVEDYFRTRSDVDAGELETSYASIRYFVWLLPTLGLIGTVMGLGVGMSHFSDIIQGAESFQSIKTALPSVTNNLGTAFDATFLAILLSAVAAFYMSFLQKRQEQVLEEIDNLCVDDVCALFQEHSTSSSEIVHAITEKVHLIIERNNGNRAQIEEVIREELPTLVAERLQGLGGALSAHLEAIARATAQMAGGQGDASERLLAEVRRLREAQEQANVELAALREQNARLLDPFKTR